MRLPNGSAGINTLTGINYMPAKAIPRTKLCLNPPTWVYEELKKRSKTSGMSLTNMFIESMMEVSNNNNQ